MRRGILPILVLLPALALLPGHAPRRVHAQGVANPAPARRYSDLTGTVPTGAIPALDASKIATGTVKLPIQDAGGQVFNVRAYGLVGDGVTPNDAAWAALLALLPATGGVVVFPAGNYLFAAPLALDSRSGVILQGVTSPQITQGNQASQVTYSGAGAAVVSMRSSKGCTLRNLAIRWNNAGFAGHAIDCRKLPAGGDTAGVLLENLNVGAVFGSGATASAAALVCLDGSHNTVIRGGNYSGGQCGIIGKLRQGIVGAGDGSGFYGYAIGVEITGMPNFAGQAVAAIKNADEAWTVSGVFEPIASGAAGAYTHDAGILANGLTFRGCWFGDDSATAAGVWITFAGNGLGLFGNTVGVNALTTAVKVDANGCNGITLLANAFTAGGGSSRGVDFGATSAHTGFVMLGSSYSGSLTTIIAGTVPAGSVYAAGAGVTLDSATFSGALTAGSVAASGPVAGTAVVAGPSTSINLLTVNQADFESGITGWGVNANCTLATTTAQAAHGARSLQVTAVADGDVSVTDFNARTAAVPGVRYYALISIRAATTTRNATIEMSAYNSSNAVLSKFAVTSSVPASKVGQWNQISCNGVAPAGTATIGVVVRFGFAGGGDTIAAGETHYMDKASVTTDGSLVWTLPGVPSVTINGSAINATGTTSGDISLNAAGGGTTFLGLAGTGGVAFGDGGGNAVAAVSAAGRGAFTSLGTAANQITFGPAAPTSGTWARGDLCWSTAVASGQPEGWRCTASGSPGSWSPMANHP